MRSCMVDAPLGRQADKRYQSGCPPFAGRQKGVPGMWPHWLRLSAWRPSLAIEE